MRISHRYKFIFFCNPKTGSESVRNMLNPYSDVLSTNFRNRTPQNPFYSHMTPLEARSVFEALHWEFGSYRKFVFVRNPWARLVSLYEMIAQNQPETAHTPGFTEWLYTIKPYGPGGGGEDWKRWRKYGTYSMDNYAGDGAGTLLVDRVIRLEDIDSDLIPYLRSLGLPDLDGNSAPHFNRRGKMRHYTEYYNGETRQLVERLYSLDIRNYHYSFDGST